MMAMLIVSAAVYLSLIACAVQIYRIGRASKLPNLYWLAMNLVTYSLGGMALFVIFNPLPYTIGLMISGLCTVMFIHTTAYRDRKSPYLFFLGLLLLLGVVQIWLSFSAQPAPTATFNFNLSVLGYVFVWVWQAYVAYQGQRGIASDRTVEDWVKARYLLWMSYSLLLFIIMGRSFIPLPFLEIEFIIMPLLVAVSGVLQYFTWAMPEFLRRYLNRNYKPVIQQDAKAYLEMSEDELLKQI